jgi:hypothetical protein
MSANSVDFPAPFGPSSTTKPPRGTTSETSSSASDGPKLWLTPRTSSASVSALNNSGGTGFITSQ